jgi:hypothetical protein
MTRGVQVTVLRTDADLPVTAITPFTSPTDHT